jgi:hypothetical protein
VLSYSRLSSRTFKEGDALQRLRVWSQARAKRCRLPSRLLKIGDKQETLRP